jgi:hypothetical protein
MGDFVRYSVVAFQPIQDFGLKIVVHGLKKYIAPRTSSRAHLLPPGDGGPKGRMRDHFLSKFQLQGRYLPLGPPQVVLIRTPPCDILFPRRTPR